MSRRGSVPIVRLFFPTMGPSVLGVLVLFLTVLTPNAHVWKGQMHRRSAEELREFHRAQKELHVKQHKHYMYNYPSEIVAVKIPIGPPHQRPTVTIPLALQLSTAGMWLISSSYPELGCKSGGYTPGSKAINLSTTWSSSAFNYNVSGQIWNDQVSFEPITQLRDFANQTYAVVNNAVDYDGNTEPILPICGAIGIGFNPDKSQQSAISQPADFIFKDLTDESQFFVVDLQCDTQNYTDGNCDIDISFGSYLDTCDDQFGYTPLSFFSTGDGGFLTFPLDGFTFGKIKAPAGDSAVADVGVPLIYVKYNVFKDMHKNLNPDYNWDYGVYTVDCGKAGKLDPWVFTVLGIEYSISSSNYVVDMGIGDGSCAVLFDHFEGFTRTEWLIGNPFFWGTCVTYDYSQNRIGFANKKTQDP
ncbi:Eukaryotic aspartyl protease [Aphelenchoides fujianensis]|nr:Eukaryotic aspartyl protease [Aphelenchoides fujianensis]